MENIVVFTMSPPHFLVCLIFNKMAIFHAKGKVELIVFVDNFGISHVIEKCLVSILELFMSPRMKHMMITTMLLDPFIKF
jgi:hypothetical protein